MLGSALCLHTAATMQAMLPARKVTHPTTHAGVVAVTTIICHQKVHTLATFITVMQNHSAEVTEYHSQHADSGVLRHDYCTEAYVQHISC